MYYVVNNKEMKQCDQNTQTHFGLPSVVLMERAAVCVVEELEKCMPDGTILIVCGNGNNGGDGLAVARLLYLRGRQVSVYLTGDRDHATPENQLQYSIIKNYSINIVDQLIACDILIDAMFGVGLSREITGPQKHCLEQMNHTKAWKAAIDLPSGINGDTGAVMGLAFQADRTITFGFRKRGQLVYPGAEYCGTLFLCDMGIDEHSFLGTYPACYVLERDDLKEIPVRPDYSNKGTFGRLLLIAGSVNMAGASIFAAKAAYRAGCGLVHLYAPKENREILQISVPQAVLSTYTQETSGEEIQNVLHSASVIAIGPGLGQSDMAIDLVRTVLHTPGKTIILDADALNILSTHMEWLQETTNICILTPHLKEMSRLIQEPVEQIQKDVIHTAYCFSKKNQVICVLKDARSVICGPDGAICINCTGNNGMAVGGSGDVLTGILASLITQGMDVMKAACMAAYLHGSAGDLMVERTGTYGLQPDDIIEGVPKILNTIK